MTVRTPPAAIPARNLKTISISALCAKYMKTHPAICGKATRKIERWRPNLLAMNPKIKVPKSPPIVRIDPIKDASPFESFPCRIGVSDDFKSGIAALVHPVDSP